MNSKGQQSAKRLRTTEKLVWMKPCLCFANVRSSKKRNVSKKIIFLFQTRWLKKAKRMHRNVEKWPFNFLLLYQCESPIWITKMFKFFFALGVYPYGFILCCATYTSIFMIFLKKFVCLYIKCFRRKNHSFTQKSAEYDHFVKDSLTTVLRP